MCVNYFLAGLAAAVGRRASGALCVTCCCRYRQRKNKFIIYAREVGVEATEKKCGERVREKEKLRRNKAEPVGKYAESDGERFLRARGGSSSRSRRPPAPRCTRLTQCHARKRAPIARRARKSSFFFLHSLLRFFGRHFHFEVVFIIRLFFTFHFFRTEFSQLITG